jgi:hypothetical protein
MANRALAVGERGIEAREVGQHGVVVLEVAVQVVQQFRLPDSGQSVFPGASDRRLALAGDAVAGLAEGRQPVVALAQLLEAELEQWRLVGRRQPVGDRF